MDIFLEGNKLDFTLEKEENLLEVIESIEGWLSNNHESINEIIIDGETILYADREELKVRSLVDIQLLEIKTHNNEEFAVNTLVELDQYIGRFLAQIKIAYNGTLDNEKKDEMIEGLSWINEVVLNVCRILCVDMNTVFLGEIPLSDLSANNNLILVELKNCKYDSQLFQEIINEKLKTNLSNLKSYFHKIINKSIFHFSTSKEFKLTNITHNLKEVLETINTFIPVIPGIATHLQTGKEFEALIEMKNVLGMMEDLVYHMRKLEEVLSFEYSVINMGDDSVDTINKDFNELLENLSTALMNKDIVLLGDILEYELIDKLEIYRKIFKELIVLAEKKSYN